jgi:hypothetical protein
MVTQVLDLTEHDRQAKRTAHHDQQQH